MLFDPRIAMLEPFVPHDLATMLERRALPEGTYDEAIHANVTKRYARLEDVAIERITYASDGFDVTGTLTRPATIQHASHPLLIFNRGGSDDYGMLTLPGLLRYHLPFAQAGYLVFASNYRGNDGGTGREEFGGADVADVRTLLDIGKHHPGWDGRNVFMFGGSRGGMMTYLCIKAGEQLNAAATFAAVSDLFDDAEKWEKLVERMRARLGADAPALDDVRRARSAIRWPEALVHTPLLIMHGDADTVVNVAQTHALEAALAPMHPALKSIYYPGGNHSLSTHSAAMIGETLDWFAQYRR
ncbi:MAG: hypothetical protein DI582_07650 [Azospirillum brasilense]|nr:MAG: hypothetical protein DI582_07650 [Azospirillum brasilense]